MKSLILSSLVAAIQALAADAVHGANSRADKPNIVLIYADDIGYGDFGCYGATAVKTPNVDRLAKEGLQFTSGYCTSATCTPSRYSMLTGEYAFRQQGTGILPGDAALIIKPGRATLPSILKKAGYTTSVVGKWHLGLGDAKGGLDWNGEIKPGPLEVGFDYSYIMAATGDRVPCVYVENHKIVGLVSDDPIEVNYKTPFPGEPTGISHRDSLKMDWSHGHNNAVVNGIGRIGFMKGGEAARWKDEDMADIFTRQALAFIAREKARPFFLYFATHDVHVPRMPFIVRWPPKVKPGVSDAIISQVDFPATFAVLTGQNPDALNFPDSLNVLPALIGESNRGRDHVVQHAGRLALRQGNWKFIPPGPVRDQLGPWSDAKAPAPGFLFDLSKDPGEQRDVAEANPAKVEELSALLKQIRESGKTPR